MHPFSINLCVLFSAYWWPTQTTIKPEDLAAKTTNLFCTMLLFPPLTITLLAVASGFRLFDGQIIDNSNHPARARRDRMTYLSSCPLVFTNTQLKRTTL